MSTHAIIDVLVQGINLRYHRIWDGHLADTGSDIHRYISAMLQEQGGPEMLTASLEAERRDDEAFPQVYENIGAADGDQIAHSIDHYYVVDMTGQDLRIGHYEKNFAHFINPLKRTYALLKDRLKWYSIDEFAHLVNKDIERVNKYVAKDLESGSSRFKGWTPLEQLPVKTAVPSKAAEIAAMELSNPFPADLFEDKKLSSNVKKALIKSFDQHGFSMHSPAGKVVWVLREHCQQRGIPFAVDLQKDDQGNVMGVRVMRTDREIECEADASHGSHIVRVYESAGNQNKDTERKYAAIERAIKEALRLISPRSALKDHYVVVDRHKKVFTQHDTQSHWVVPMLGLKGISFLAKRDADLVVQVSTASLPGDGPHVARPLQEYVAEYVNALQVVMEEDFATRKKKAIETSPEFFSPA